MCVYNFYKKRTEIKKIMKKTIQKTWQSQTKKIKIKQTNKRGKKEEMRNFKHIDNHNCIGLKLWQNTTQIPNHFCSPKWIHDRLWHYCLMSNLKKILYGETGIFKNNYLQRKIIWLFVEMASDLCKNIEDNLAVIKLLTLLMAGENKRFVSMDSTNDSNSLELEVHKGTGVYISICLLGSVRQLIKIWLPRRL